MFICYVVKLKYVLQSKTVWWDAIPYPPWCYLSPWHSPDVWYGERGPRSGDLVWLFIDMLRTLVVLHKLGILLPHVEAPNRKTSLHEVWELWNWALLKAPLFKMEVEWYVVLLVYEIKFREDPLGYQLKSRYWTSGVRWSSNGIGRLGRRGLHRLNLCTWIIYWVYFLGVSFFLLKIFLFY